VVESVEGTGRTVDEAIENALDDLGLERDEVTITVLTEGERGEGARVLVTPHEDLEEIDDIEEEVGEVDEQPQAAAPVRPPADAQVVATLAADILSEMLDYMDLASDVEIDQAELDDGLPSVQLSIHGEYGGILIGRHGDTLAAIQFILGLITSRRADRRVRIVVDVEGYRERRAKLLRDMALRAAERAQRYRQPIFMDPMMPAERRIVHLALQDHPSVSTHSIGEGENRRVVVSPRQAQRFGGYGVN
jgi:spoIIIJ-associated protein